MTFGADPFAALVRGGASSLAATDAELHDALVREQLRQERCLSLVASSGVVDPSVLAACASPGVNVTAEGYPGRRYHAGCDVVDDVERLAVARACDVFGATYANVQPHSASTANYTVLTALLDPGDTFLGMALDQGGHLTHGSPAALAGTYFRSVGYGLTPDGDIDYAGVRSLAVQYRPKVIVCGATAYPRAIDFAAFRAVADHVGAYLVADISHTAGLVAAGLHPSPIDHAHVTTTCTHKQLYGPRGGLIMSGRDAAGPGPGGRTLAAVLDRAVFPFTQGAPAMNTIAGKARAFALASTPAFAATMARVVSTASALAGGMAALGYDVVTGGTDNHIVLVDLTRTQVTGLAAEQALEQCNVIVNKNRVPGDTRSAHVTSGVRLGTNTIARRGMGPSEAALCAALLDRVLVELRDPAGAGRAVDPLTAAAVRDEVADLCASFPLPGYPRTAAVASVGAAG